MLRDKERRWYEQLAKAAATCPLCGDTGFTELAHVDRYDMGIRTCGCNSCGLVQTAPRPSADAMREFYAHHYRRFYQATVSPSAEYVQKLNKNARLKLTAKFLSKLELPEAAKVLDVGCSEGTLFQELLKTRTRLTLFGVEPNDKFGAFATQSTGATVFSSLASLVQTRPELRFDLIVVNHVLEHVDDPVKFLVSLASILSAGGRIYVDVPDVSRYHHLVDLHIAHQFHFSADTLRATFLKAGLHSNLIEAHEPPHHPASVRAVASKQGGASNDSVQSRVGWEAVQAIQRNAWRPLLRRRLVRVLGLRPLKLAVVSIIKRSNQHGLIRR